MTAPTPEEFERHLHEGPTLTEFILARVAEWEAMARAASPSPWQYGDVDSVAGGSLYDQTRMIGDLHYEQPTDHDGSIVRHLFAAEADANGTHIAAHDPARVLAQCAAYRRIVEGCVESQYGWIIQELASIWADHADFHPGWRT